MALLNWLCASYLCTSLLCALHELRRAISHESGLRKLHCSRLLCASCSLQAAARKLLSASCCASALCKLLCASALSKLLCASALRQLLRASALRKCFVQVGLRKLVCASCSAQVLCASALCKLLCASCSAQVTSLAQVALRKWECTSRTVCVLKSCDFPAGAASIFQAHYVCT